jgi:protein tyrosine/serine phosphatase
MRYLFVLIMATIITGCATQRGFPPTGGVPNLDRVSSELYRSGEFNELGLEYIKSLGVKTIIDFRLESEVWPQEKKLCESMGILYINIPMNNILPSNIQQMNFILKTIEDSPKPVLGCCVFGCERTGQVAACYRIRHGESNADALKDAEKHGMSDWAVGMKEFIKKFK